MSAIASAASISAARRRVDLAPWRRLVLSSLVLLCWLWFVCQLAEHVGDVGAGATERLAAQLAPPGAAEQYRRQVVDRAPGPAAPAMATPPLIGAVADRTRRVPIDVARCGARDQPVPRHDDPGDLLEVVRRRDPLVRVRVIADTPTSPDAARSGG